MFGAKFPFLFHEVRTFLSLPFPVDSSLKQAIVFFFRKTHPAFNFTQYSVYRKRSNKSQESSPLFAVLSAHWDICSRVLMSTFRIPNSEFQVLG